MKRLWYQFRTNERVGLCMAVFVAAMFSDVTSKAAWLRIWRALTLFLGLFKDGGKEVESSQRERRYMVCITCPIFYQPLGTCGSPLKAEIRDMGCWCFMLSKSRYEAATCWLDDELGEEAPHGWKIMLTSQS